MTADQCSPRTRGWTVALATLAIGEGVFPAHAGMDRPSVSGSSGCGRFRKRRRSRKGRGRNWSGRQRSPSRTVLESFMYRYLLAPLALFSSSVLAAVPEAVTTELATAKTDATTVAGLAIAIVVAVAAFKYMRSAIK